MRTSFTSKAADSGRISVELWLDCGCKGRYLLNISLIWKPFPYAYKMVAYVMIAWDFKTAYNIYGVVGRSSQVPCIVIRKRLDSLHWLQVCARSLAVDRPFD